MSEDDKKEITLSPKETRIEPWGRREEIREIARRIRLMAPGAKKLNENEALALAQGAIAHGLDPFNGEIWFIPGSGLMAGIKGLRKAARLQIAGNFWPEFEEITNPDDRVRLMIPEGALAYKCLIRDSDTIRSYSEAWKELKEAGVPVDLIPDVIGSKPYTLGIGYLKKGESTRMDPVQVAMKRAEADAIKRRFDLPFAVPSQPNDMPIIVEGEWYEATEEGGLEKVAVEGSATLYGVVCPACDGALQDPPPMDCPHCGVKGIGHKFAAEKPAVSPPDQKEKKENEREFSNSLLNKIVERGLAPDVEEALKGLRRSPWNSKDVPLRTHTNVIDWYQVFQAERDRGARSDKAARIATEGAKGIT